jgi:hypothetical protein
VVAGVITESWAPGTLSKEESEVEWARRAAITKKIQATRITAKSLPIEWISKSYLEPIWTNDDMKRFGWLVVCLFVCLFPNKIVLNLCFFQTLERAKSVSESATGRLGIA